MGDELHTMASSAGTGYRTDRPEERRPMRRPGPRRYALMLATIVFTKSRGGAIGLCVMLGAFVLLGRKIRPGSGAGPRGYA